ncbi:MULTISPECIES: Flp family type IVb pilin [unclassified Pseudomonas]|uniref:Flp family type IVb pilin n=1 Tax=unclassified Pseudomonas TaxID=196821 RepID=UPI000CD10CE4|nr:MULTISPECIES: Flp family type IVb pilin [unclassified Pseudomonas]POA30313.1 Flp family type IVb pilin [Pseudomonas sp. GW456-R21]POA67119.1 Flp family type IVb pilin [Pseudomonas sp. GW460-R15]
MFLHFVQYLSIRFQLFMSRTEGASAIEYALIVAMVALVVVSFIVPLGDSVKATFNKVVGALGGVQVT